MPFADNRGTRIHYEIEGQGPPLVLQYGQYFPLDVWYELNYVSALKSDCQLILVDARGHGDSDKPHDPEAYRIELMAQDIISVLDALGLEQAHYMGYSSGGYLGFGLARFAPERFSSFILGGAATSADQDNGLAWRDEQVRALEKQTTAEFVAGLEGFLASQKLLTVSPRMHARLLTHDTRALIAWLRGTARWPSLYDVLGAIAVPCLLYAGENSGEYAEACETAQAIPNAAFVGIPNGGHLEGGTWIDILRPHILQTVKQET